MGQIEIIKQIKNASLIVVVIVVYLSPVLLSAQEVDEGSTKRYHQNGLNTYNYHKNGSIGESSFKRKILHDRPMKPYLRFISPRQPTDKRVIRDFVLYNYAHVADDIINGKGMYLETLFYLLGVKTEEKRACLYDMREMLVEYERIPDFSNSIAVYGNQE